MDISIYIFVNSLRRTENLADTHIELLIHLLPLGVEDPEEGDHLPEWEVVEIVTPPTSHPDQPELLRGQSLHFVLRLGGDEVIFCCLRNVEGNANGVLLLFIIGILQLHGHDNTGAPTLTEQSSMRNVPAIAICHSPKGGNKMY